VSPPPPRRFSSIATFDNDDEEVNVQEDIEIDSLDQKGDDQDSDPVEEGYKHSSPTVTANIDSEGYDPEGDVDPLSPSPPRDSEGYDPNADIDPPSPSAVTSNLNIETARSGPGGGQWSGTSDENTTNTSQRRDRGGLTTDPIEEAFQPQQSTEESTNPALKDVYEFGKSIFTAPFEGVAGVGKSNMDIPTGLSTGDARMLDSEGYDPDADIDPPSDDELNNGEPEDADIDELSDDGKEMPSTTSSTLPTTANATKTTVSNTPRRNARQTPKPMHQSADTAVETLPVKSLKASNQDKVSSKTTTPTPSSIVAQKLTTKSPLPSTSTDPSKNVSFPHSRATDTLIRHLHSKTHSLATIAKAVNEHFALQNLDRRIDSRGIYSRLTILKHLYGSNSDPNEGMRGRTNTRQSNLFVAPREVGPGSSAGAATGSGLAGGSRALPLEKPAIDVDGAEDAIEAVENKKTFSLRDDEALVRIYDDKCRRFWDEVAREMEMETGRRFEKGELEERYAAI